MALRSIASRVLVWVLIVLAVPGCSTWRAAPLSPDVPVAAAIQPAPVKLRLMDTRTITLHDWTFEADTLRGTRDAWVEGTRVRKTETIALIDVVRREGGTEGEDLREFLAAKQAMVVTAREQAAASPWSTQFPGVVRVRLVDGSTIKLENTAADADSLRGNVPVSTADPSHRLVILARKDVVQIERSEYDSGKTGAGVVLLIAAIVVGFGAMMAAAFAE